MKVPGRRGWIATTFAGAVLLGATWSIFSGAPDPGAKSVAAARRASFDIRVDVVGVLDAARGENVISSLRADRGKIIQIVADGARVEKDDVLVRFDSAPIESEALRLAGELRSREAVVAFTRQSVELEKAQVEKALANAELEAQNSRQEHARYLAYIDDLEALARRDIPVAGELGQAQRKAAALKVQLQKAESAVERMKRESVYRLAQVMAEEKKAVAEAGTTRDARDLVRAELEKTILRAPGSGFVVLHETFHGDQKRRLRAGDTVWQGQPILYLPDLSAFIVRARVREEDLHKIGAGQEATVRVDAYPELALRARVSGVGALALENAVAGAAGKHFQLTVALEARDERLRPGMTARAEIISDRVRDVLALPIPAIFYQGSQAICYSVGGDGIAAHPVTLGRRGDDLVEVLAGLAEGDRVSLVKP